MLLVQNYMMPTTSLTLVVLVLALFATPSLQQGQQPNPIPTYIDVECLNGTANYTQNSLYQLNLKTLLSSLETNSSFSSFFQTSVAEASDDTVYGRYFCRHDLSLPVCSSCVHAATDKIVANCPTFKEAIVWFEQCTLIYLNSSTRLEAIDLASPYIIVGNNQVNVTDPAAYAPVLQATLNQVINESAYGPGSEGFATEEGKVSKLQTLYSLAQCSPDRVGLLCERCLKKALREVDICCSQYVHVAFFYPNCQLRFGVTGPFYNVTKSPTPASPPPPPPITQVPKDPGHPGNWAIGRMSKSFLNLGILMALSTLMILGN